MIADRGTPPRLVDDAALTLTVEIDKIEIAQLSEGQTASVMLDARPEGSLDRATLEAQGMSVQVAKRPNADFVTLTSSSEEDTSSMGHVGSASIPSEAQRPPHPGR